MTRQDLAALLGAMSGEQQEIFLVRASLMFNMSGRSVYRPDSDDVDNPAHLRKVNEAQNRIASHLLAVLTGNAQRYPDAVLANIMVDQCEQAGYR